MKELSEDVRKFIAYDKSIANLKEAGLADAFIASIQKDPEVMKAVEKMAPKSLSAARTGWSCCITVSNPM